MMTPLDRWLAAAERTVEALLKRAEARLVDHDRGFGIAPIEAEDARALVAVFDLQKRIDCAEGPIHRFSRPELQGAADVAREAGAVVYAGRLEGGAEVLRIADRVTVAEPDGVVRELGGVPEDASLSEIVAVMRAPRTPASPCASCGTPGGSPCHPRCPDPR